MNNTLHIKAAVIAAILSVTPAVSADDDTGMNMQEPKKSFTSVGANLSLQTIGGDTIFGAGIEGLYMRKVWDWFSVGGSLSAQSNFRKVINDDTNVTGGLSLLLGSIHEHNNGARSTLFVGPTLEAGGSDVLIAITAGGRYQFPESHWTLGASVSSGLGIDRSSDINDTTKFRISVGYTF